MRPATRPQCSRSHASCIGTSSRKCHPDRSKEDHPAPGTAARPSHRAEERLRERLAGTGVSVTRNGNDITLEMPGNITFDMDRSDVKPRFSGVLDSVFDVLKDFERTIVEVAGRTGDVGAGPYNQQVPKRRGMTVGAGETRPVADKGTEQGR